MKKIICVACFTLFALAANAQDLKGTWVMDSTPKEVITTNVDDIIGKSFADDSKIEKEQPAVLFFDDYSLYLTYADNTIIWGEYRYAEGVLELFLSDGTVQYEAVLQEENLSLKRKEVLLLFNKLK